ncbi:hypothetical protein P3612_11045 [Vibrio parahaemolyticus]|uniref:hypothetical protein n=1 Tax=unclassified Vibrio TaxID=2614977 RepID=UPI0029FF8632|nr:hypothetical protein [Vibrio parahaemolyticus]
MVRSAIDHKDIQKLPTKQSNANRVKRSYSIGADNDEKLEDLYPILVAAHRQGSVSAIVDYALDKLFEEMSDKEIVSKVRDKLNKR